MGINPDLATFARTEYRQPGDFSLSLQAVLHPPKNFEKPPSDLQLRLGTVFQRKVMTPIEIVRSPMVDKTAEPISEIVMNLAKAGLLADYFAFLYAINRLPKHINHEGNIDIGVAIIPTAIVAGGLYIYSHRDQLRILFENMRLQPSRQLGLDTYPLNDKELYQDTSACISGMNDRIYAFTELGDAVDTQATINAVHEFMSKVYGFDTPATRRPKITRKPSQMARSKYGFTHPLVGEVVVLHDKDQSTIAHEMTHTQGVVKESEAEFSSIVALLESRDPRLQYYGYDQWLTRLVQVQLPNWFGRVGFENIEQKHDAIRGKLRELGLSDACILRMDGAWNHIEALKGKDSTSRLDKGVEKLDAILTQGLNKLTGGYISRRFATRQWSTPPSIQARYSEKPVQLLHSYCCKYPLTRER